MRRRRIEALYRRDLPGTARGRISATAGLRVQMNSTASTAEARLRTADSNSIRLLRSAILHDSKVARRAVSRHGHVRRSGSTTGRFSLVRGAVDIDLFTCVLKADRQIADQWFQRHQPPVSGGRAAERD